MLHGRHWVAITGKPLGATAGAKMFERGGNAVEPKTSGPSTAIYFDQEQRTFWGGASNYGDDYGIAW